MPKKQPNPVDAQVGNRVRLRRMLIGMSQEKLGEELGLTFQQVQKYEKGVNRIGAGRLFHVAQILGVKIDYFYEGATEEMTGGSSGFSEEPAAQQPVMDFLASNEGLQLSLAYMRIKSPKLRRRVVELIKAIAGEDDEEPAG